MDRLLLHQKPRSKASLSDEYGTPDGLYIYLTKKYGINPMLDVCATLQNTKCPIYFTKDFDSLKNDWNIINSFEFSKLWCDIWMNPPHSLTKEFVKKAHEQWKKFNMNIITVIPANSMCTHYAEQYIEGSAEYHPIFGRPTFLVKGKKSKFPARNSYFVVIWRKK